MRNLYIVKHSPTGIWQFAVDETEGHAIGYVIKKRAEDLLYDQIESHSHDTIQDLVAEFEVIKIGEEHDNELQFNDIKTITIR